MEPGSWQQFFGLISLLFLSAFFSISETALTTVSKIRVRNMVEEGLKGAASIQKALENPKKLLSAILIGNNLVNIAASALTTSISMQLWGNNSKALSISTVALTFIVLVFCEITPKTYAAGDAEKIALLVAAPIRVCLFVFTPFVNILSAISAFLIKLLGGDYHKDVPLVTEAELKTMVNVSLEEGVLMNDEQEMINNVFDFGDFVAKDVMTPRTDITAINYEATYDEIMEAFKTERFSRLPVYKESTDDIVGILQLRDFAFTDKQTFKLDDYMREPFFTYESKPTRELFATMRANSVLMAVILDEYGGTSGIVTLEDLIEEIVGDIADEFDDFEQEIETISDNEYIVLGETKINDVNDFFNTSIESEDFDSIGGYFSGVVGHIPGKNEFIIEGDVKFIVHEVDKNRIEKLKVVIEPKN